MSEYHRDTAFLRHCIRYDDSAERQQLEESITQAQRDERCVRRAVWLMLLFIGLAMAGLCYSAVFLQEDFPRRTSQFASRFVVKIFCALGLGSLISLMAFVGLGAVYRKRLDQRREECRRLAMKLLESRLGQPVATPLQGGRSDDRNGHTVQVAAGGNGSLHKTEPIDDDGTMELFPSDARARCHSQVLNP